MVLASTLTTLAGAAGSTLPSPDQLVFNGKNSAELQMHGTSEFYIHSAGEYMVSHVMIIPAGRLTASEGPGESHTFIFICTTTLSGAREEKVTCLNANQ